MLCGVETKVLGQFMLAVGQLEKSNIYRWDKRQEYLCKKRWENRVREDHSKEQGMFRRWSTDTQEKPWQSVESRLQREAAGNRAGDWTGKLIFVLKYLKQYIMVLKVFIPIILQILYITMKVGRIKEGRKEEGGNWGRANSLTSHFLQLQSLLLLIFSSKFFERVIGILFPVISTSQIGVPFPTNITHLWRQDPVQRSVFSPPCPDLAEIRCCWKSPLVSSYFPGVLSLSVQMS